MDIDQEALNVVNAYDNSEWKSESQRKAMLQELISEALQKALDDGH